MCARISDSPKSPKAPDTRDAGLKLDILRARLRNVTLDVVWRQWRALGAGAGARGGGGGHASSALFDPQGLLPVSVVLLFAGGRVGNILHDWGARNSHLLSAPRG